MTPPGWAGGAAGQCAHRIHRARLAQEMLRHPSPEHAIVHQDVPEGEVRAERAVADLELLEDVLACLHIAERAERQGFRVAHPEALYFNQTDELLVVVTA